MDNVNIFNIRFLIGLLAAAGVLAILNLALTLYILDRNNLLTPREIVSINAADMLMGFVAAQDPSISEDELKARIVRLNGALDSLILDFAARNDLVVVNSAAVLGGTRDVTPLLLSQLGMIQSEVDP